MAGEFTPEMIDAILGGSKAAPAPVASAAPTAGGIWDFLTKARTLGGTAKVAGAGALAAGKGALAVGKGFLHPATLIPSVAGVAASKMAGGDIASGLDPAMFARALGEGYAQRAPTWLGGLTNAEIAAGKELGAGDIEGRFGAVPPARTAPTPAPVVAPAPAGGPSVADYGALYTAPAPAPVNAPFTSADFEGGRVPISGTGAFRNERTGVVTNLDTRGSPGFGAVPARSAGDVIARGTGAMMNIKERTGAAVQQTAQNKMLVELLTKQPGMTKNAAEAQVANATLELAQRHLQAGGSPAEASAILGHRADVGPQFSVPLSAMPGPKGELPVLQTRGKGAGAVRQVTPQKTFTQADLTTSMKSSGKPREQVLRDARAAGYAVEAGL